MVAILMQKVSQTVGSMNRLEKVAVFRSIRNDPRVQNLLQAKGFKRMRYDSKGVPWDTPGTDEANLSVLRREMGDKAPMWLRNNSYGAYPETNIARENEILSAMPRRRIKDVDDIEDFRREWASKYDRLPYSDAASSIYAGRSLSPWKLPVDHDTVASLDNLRPRRITRGDLGPARSSKSLRELDAERAQELSDQRLLQRTDDQIYAIDRLFGRKG